MQNIFEFKGGDKWVSREPRWFIFFHSLSLRFPFRVNQSREISSMIRVRSAYESELSDWSLSNREIQWRFAALDATAFQTIMRRQTDNEWLSLREWQHGARWLCRKNKPPDKARKHPVYYEINVRWIFHCLRFKLIVINDLLHSAYVLFCGFINVA